MFSSMCLWLMCVTSYDHQWTFLREFHVSPFNDRSGFYTVSVKSPTHPPTPNTLSLPSDFTSPPRPAVRIYLYTRSTESPDIPPKPGALKLTALLRPVSARPLTTTSLLLSLSRAPFSLFLSLPRILFEAWKLHYTKRLDVFIRPEPLPPAPQRGHDFGAASRRLQFGGGVKWLSEGLLERYARWCLESFLRRRADETNTVITLVASDPAVPDLIFSPSHKADSLSCSHLIVSYLSPRFFTIVFLCPSASHAFLLGSETEKIFFVSSKELFIFIFSLPAGSVQLGSTSSLQRLRAGRIPSSIGLLIPPAHALDDSSIISHILSTAVIFILLFLDSTESWIFNVIHARVVPGEEPWKQWERAGAVLKYGKFDRTMRDTTGSVRRDN